MSTRAAGVVGDGLSVPVSGAVVLGWRWWSVTPEGLLASPVDRIPWLSSVFRASVCAVNPGHVPPERGCTCGVYAFTSEGDTRAHIAASRLAARLSPSVRARVDVSAPVVLGRVEMSSDVVVAKEPPASAAIEYKASAARITRLYVEDDVLAGLLAPRYRVPVCRPGEVAK